MTSFIFEILYLGTVAVLYRTVMLNEIRKQEREWEQRHIRFLRRAR